MDKQEILKLIDNKATDLELESYNEAEVGNYKNSEFKREQAKSLREIQKEIRENG